MECCGVRIYSNMSHYQKSISDTPVRLPVSLHELSLCTHLYLELGHTLEKYAQPNSLWIKRSVKLIKY